MGIKASAGYCAPTSLTPYDRNSRVHTPRQIERIKASISEFGFTKPVIIDSDGVILAGHGAVTAAIELELTRIPYRRISGLSDEQKRAYVIADNKTSDESKWDEGLLALELEDLQSLDPALFEVAWGTPIDDSKSNALKDVDETVTTECPKCGYAW